MKKIVIFILGICFFPLLPVIAQDFSNNEKILKQIADNLLRENIRGFVDYSTGKIYNDASNIDPLNGDVWFISVFPRMQYYNGVINMAMLELGDLLKNKKYIDYSMMNYDFIFNNSKYFKGKANGRSKYGYPFGQMFVFEELDDCGTMGAFFIDSYLRRRRDDAKIYINKTADFMLNKMTRLNDGTYCRSFPVDKTIWADDLYMSVPFLVRMGKMTGDNKYYDEAIKQILLFTKYLWDHEDKLYHHGWFSDNNTASVAYWGRANGWIAMAQVELLKYLPLTYPKRQQIIDNLNRQLINVSHFQSADGLWHQLLDKEDSFLEVSSTAMFTYAIAYAVNQGFLPQRYFTVALLGWKGICDHSDNGKIYDICMGTGIKNDLNYYYTRPTRPNDVGFGAVIFAGLEILKYEAAHGTIRVDDRDHW